LSIFDTLRQNHALEHATVALLKERLGQEARLVGMATGGGFYIYGELPTEMVEEAAREGLHRLRQGEKELAVSAFCGTNMVVAGVLAGLSSLAAIRGSEGLNRVPRAILAALVAVLLSQPLGRLAQKYLTTSSDLSALSIVAVSKMGRGTATRHKVETTSLF